MPKSLRLCLLLAAALTAAACQESSSPTASGNPRFSLTELSQDSNPSQLAVAQAVPGFGGYYLDAQGYPAVYLLDPAQRPAAEAALAAFLASRGFTASDLRVLQGDFAYTQLDSWYGLARGGVFGVAGAFLGDVDEGHNRLRFGVVNGAAAQNVLAVLAGLGIPQSAVMIQERPAIVPVATLRDRVRPITGALQINFFATPTAAPTVVSLICTVGFNVVRFGISGFMTNSHCTNVEGGEDTPTDYYQSRRSQGEGSFIGTELDDPYWTSYLNLDCPPPLACRYSDAALVAYAPGVPAAFGQIAKVDHITTSLDDTAFTIAGSFRIRAERDDPTQGETVNKVGRTTGWTTGVTTGTCIDVLALETNHIRLCQAEVSALVDAGDSGSPVFWRRGNKNDVTLLGILWGGSATGDPSFVYSPLSGIRRELGNIAVF